jgi:26S proteasome regulatory subunit T1
MVHAVAKTEWTLAVAICVIGSELVQKYVVEGAHMVRELFTMARSKRVCIVFFC